MRVIFYAEPTSLDMSESIKTLPDEHSLEAAWASLQEIKDLKNQ